jgi:large subunit ribosomal protein L21
MFAVIRSGGKQYRVAASDVVEIEKIAGAEGDAVAFGEVLMVGGDDGVTVGSPLVAGASVAGEIVAHTRDAKILVFKKRRRKNSRRSHGHRQFHTTVRITEILTDGKAPAKARPKAAPKAKAAPAVESKAAKPPVAAKPPAAAKAPKPAVAPRPVAPARARAGAAGDDLKKLSGVGAVIEKKLNGLGITTFAEIAAWTAADIARIDESLNFRGRIERDDWVGQAKKLAAGGK